MRTEEVAVSEEQVPACSGACVTEGTVWGEGEVVPEDVSSETLSGIVLTMASIYWARIMRLALG